MLLSVYSRMNTEEHNQSFIDDVAAAAVAITPIRTPDVVSKNQQRSSANAACSDGESVVVCTSSTPYQARTIRLNSISSQRRADLLPAYPLASSSHHTAQTLLLLSNVINVDREKCEQESFCGGHGVCPFEFKQHRYVEPIDSFMVDLFRELFMETSRRWRIHYSLIDYNLSRLRKCMDIYTKHMGEPAIASMHELPVALEFFLQLDGRK